MTFRSTFLLYTFLLSTFLMSTFLLSTFPMSTFLLLIFLLSTFLLSVFIFSSFLLYPFHLSSFLQYTFLRLHFFPLRFFSLHFFCQHFCCLPQVYWYFDDIYFAKKNSTILLPKYFGKNYKKLFSSLFVLLTFVVICSLLFLQLHLFCIPLLFVYFSSVYTYWVFIFSGVFFLLCLSTFSVPTYVFFSFIFFFF